MSANKIRPRLLENKNAALFRPSFSMAPDVHCLPLLPSGPGGFHRTSPHGTEPTEDRNLTPKNWRRGWDLTPRSGFVAAYSLSRRAPSTARPPLLMQIEPPLHVNCSIIYIIWRRGWDLNPRDGSSPPSRFRVDRLRPLGHLSIRHVATEKSHPRSSCILQQALRLVSCSAREAFYPLVFYKETNMHLP